MREGLGSCGKDVLEKHRLGQEGKKLFHKTLEVGKMKKSVHRNIQYSSYFQSALETNFLENQNGKL